MMQRILRVSQSVTRYAQRLPISINRIVTISAKSNLGKWHNNHRHFSSNISTTDGQHTSATGTISHESLCTDRDLALLTPKQVVEELDRFIVGQREAKRAVAVALRNRWRRQQLAEDMREEIMPKNILMIGPTGVGKTEIARRLAKLVSAPFIKVEATKFTEVGFHGRDVDQIIRDLVDASINLTRDKMRKRLQKEVDAATETAIVDILVGSQSRGDTRNTFLRLLRNGSLENNTIEVELPSKTSLGFDIFAGQQGAPFDLQSRMGKMFTAKEKKRLKLSEARPLIAENELEKLLSQEVVIKEAVENVQQGGIVFIDEIDKICSTSEYSGGDASAEGVQRDLLPIIEGSSVSTRYGNVKTDHILFIASGAFHTAKPSDLLAELQGRLPIRVELQALSVDDLYEVLTVPENNLIRQQIALLKTEGMTLVFEDAAVREIAAVAAEVNTTVENIGARRLHTVMERIVEEISFTAPERKGETVTVTAALVREKVGDMLLKTDLSKFVL